MNIWTILNITPTNDKKTIRKAYTKELKFAHPEEEPEKFKTLRSAYEQALNYINTDNSIKSKPEDLIVDETIIKSNNIQTEKDLENETLIDFDSLFNLQKNMQTEAILQKQSIQLLDAILANNKNINNKKVWRNYFFSFDFLIEYHIQGFWNMFVVYLQTQLHIPSDKLPRSLCVWLYITSSWHYYKEQENRKKLVELTSLHQLLKSQTQANFNNSDLLKKENEILRQCFANYNILLTQYEQNK